MKHLITFCVSIITFTAFGQIKNTDMKKEKPNRMYPNVRSYPQERG